MAEMYNIKGGGTVEWGGSLETMHWTARVTVDEIRSFLSSMPSQAVDDAEWKLSDGQKAHDLYINVHLPVEKLNVPNFFLLVEHPDLGWIAHDSFLATQGNPAEHGNVGIEPPNSEQKTERESS
jgi:hypothetical protein